MSEITLGTLRIVDNGDGVFRNRAPAATARLRPGIRREADRILDAEGRELRPDAAEVRALLATLGLTSLQGLRLSPAGQYLASVSEAERLAREGRTPEARRNLEAAREWARQAGLTFNETRAEQILMRSAVAELGQLEAEARAAAEAGNLVALEDARQAARDVLGRIGTPLEQWESSGLPFPPSRAQALEIRALRQARPALLQRATSLAESGAVARLQETLARLRDTYSRAGDPLTEETAAQLQALERRAHAQALPDYFRRAEEAATQGRVEEYRRLAAQVRDTARLSGTPFPRDSETRLQALESRAFAASANRLLDQLEPRIARARRREEEIDMDEVRITLQSSREHATLYGNPWSADQASRAERLRAQAFEANLAYRFRQAREAAAQGKVDDTLVPLRAAREMAAQAGIAFDEARAAALLHQALVNGVELSFRNAACFALSLDEPNARIHLETARDYCARLHQVFPENRAREILALIRRPLRERQARLAEGRCSALLHPGQSYWPEEAAEDP